MPLELPPQAGSSVSFFFDIAHWGEQLLFLPQFPPCSQVGIFDYWAHGSISRDSIPVSHYDTAEIGKDLFLRFVFLIDNS